MANYQTQFSCRIAVGAGNVEAALALYAQMQAELGDIDIGFEAERNCPEDDALWLCDGDGAGDVEDVIAFALRCGVAFNLTGYGAFAGACLATGLGKAPLVEARNCWTLAGARAWAGSTASTGSA